MTHPTISRPAAEMICPFHNGAATLDALLAEINPDDTQLFDAVLDLRCVAVAGCDALGCVEQLFRVRRLLGDRHYLAFYRVRCWAHRALHVEVRAHRAAAWIARPLPLNGGRVDEVINAALAVLATSESIPAAAHARFIFSASVAAASPAPLLSASRC